MRSQTLLAWLSLGLLSAALLSGCLQQGGNGEGGGHEAGWTGDDQYNVHIVDVSLHDTISPGSPETWAFRVENRGSEGENEVEYNAACEGPFEVAMSGPDGRTVHPEEPPMECMAIDTQVLRGGDRLDHTWTWDGRIWSEGDGEEAASEGIYTIRVAFFGKHAGIHDTEAWGETTVLVAG